MFTWNLQYISKTRLADTLRQLMIDSEKGDILIRIHTAIHTADEAVDLAAFVKGVVPGASILGTSTSAVIHEGKLHPDQCLISVTQMERAGLKAVRLSIPKDVPAREDDPKASARQLCQEIKDTIVQGDEGFLLTFFSAGYRDVKRFVEVSNEIMPGFQMIGGIAGGMNLAGSEQANRGFIFDETGWSASGVIAACFGGQQLSAVGSMVTGVQIVDEELKITKAEDNVILGIDNTASSEKYRAGIGDAVRKNPELSFLFPLVYVDHKNVPFMFGYTDEGLRTNHNIDVGETLKRGFIYDKKIIADNRSAFNRIETFEKAETIFGYSCRDRSRLYPNSVMWELSIYENSNISGCLTEGEIGCIDHVNVFANCAFSIAAVGENESYQQFNPYVFSNTNSLETDNDRLIGYLMEIEDGFTGSSVASTLKDFIRNCELKLLYTEDDGILNAAALNMDIKIGGYDRVCVIDVVDTSRMGIVFPEQRIDATRKNFLSKCAAFVSGTDYRMYHIDQWKVAIAAPSYMVSLRGFTEEMRQLQKILFQTSEQFIAIVPVFCVINESSADTLSSVYSTARVEMMNKNIQFYVCDGSPEEIDEESIRQRYHMVNVINYALTHDKVIPYFQGIYDNVTKGIHHYESLIRLEDEYGKIYYPGSFLDVARSFGLLYDELSRAMVAKVFERFKNCADQSVSINLGMRDIQNRDMTDFIFGFLSTAKYPGNFVFEILENEDVDDYELLVRFVDKVHKLGGQISIDDFGSGYSNLQHLASIHSDYIKIDGSIVKNCCKDPESENLVALVSDWKRLSVHDVKIVAEFVENGDIQKKLIEYGIDFSQGYFFSVPAPKLISEN
ncbi:MAG: EAL domain-containing protein [Lachnospiraceae bacterium]|nr:EAL domain-containing protein [Lachnospiraceae bacterium]